MTSIELKLNNNKKGKVKIQHGVKISKNFFFGFCFFCDLGARELIGKGE
jgi:hypothetical protein